eukprot:scaffold2341_cov100-Isochrysis_galbana.AAC.2
MDGWGGWARARAHERVARTAYCRAAPRGAAQGGSPRPDTAAEDGIAPSALFHRREDRHTRIAGGVATEAARDQVPRAASVAHRQAACAWRRTGWPAHRVVSLPLCRRLADELVKAYGLHAHMTVAECGKQWEPAPAQSIRRFHTDALSCKARRWLRRRPILC